VKALHSAICRQKKFPWEYFLAADRGDVYIIKGHKNVKSFISLIPIQKWCIQKIAFLKKVCLGVGFPSLVSNLRESGKWESRISEQILCRQNLCKFVVHLVTSNQRFWVSKEQKCTFHFWQLFI